MSRVDDKEKWKDESPRAKEFRKDKGLPPLVTDLRFVTDGASVYQVNFYEEGWISIHRTAKTTFIEIRDLSPETILSIDDNEGLYDFIFREYAKLQQGKN